MRSDAQRRSRALLDIELERNAQDDQWGGPDHDDDRGHEDWITYIVKQLGKPLIGPWNWLKYRDGMVKVGALALAAIEWTDRHLDHVANRQKSARDQS